MGLWSNVIIFITILIVIIVATVVSCYIPNEKPGGQLVCEGGNQVLVDGECKAGQLSPCNQTSDCAPNLECTVDKTCNTPALLGVLPPVPVSVVENFTDVSSDSEVNSVGDVREVPFDVRSAETLESGGGVISTPYQEVDGRFYCKGISEVDGTAVIDACSYSTGIVFLLDNGNIIYQENSQRVKVGNNVKLIRIVNFAGYVTGLSLDGKIYTCSDANSQLAEWTWNRVTWAQLPKDIIYINTPYDGKRLAVQDKTSGYVFNESGGLVNVYRAVNEIRIYGRDFFSYATLNFDTNSAKLVPSGRQILNIVDLAFDYHGEILTIPLQDKGTYKRIAMVNWKPYFVC